MIVTATGDRLRFHVSSDSGEQPDGYIVDMAAMNGNGHCLCRDFQCRCEPAAIKNNHAIVNFGLTGRTRCRHINAVLLHLGQLVVDGARKNL